MRKSTGGMFLADAFVGSLSHGWKASTHESNCSFNDRKALIIEVARAI